MPNGVMTGTGTMNDPLIVFDGYDFNALRSVASSSGGYKYIELGANINLSMYANFIPIPDKYFNIDGKGFNITDIYLSVNRSENYVGLFGKLYSNEYIKDFKIDGAIDVLNNVNYDHIACGSLCGELVLSNNAAISNVEAYFELNYATSYSVKIGGLAGTLTISGKTNMTVTECAFKGSISVSSTNSGTVYKMLIGGLFGQVYCDGWPDATNVFTIEKCQSDAQYYIDNRLDMHLAGIFGILTQGANNTTACFEMKVRMCVTKITVRFTHTGNVTTNTHRVSGITSVPAYWNNQKTTLEKCVSFIDVLWTHQFTINVFRLAGLLFSGDSFRISQILTINQGYAVMRMINPDGLPWTGISGYFGSLTYVNSSYATVSVNNAFFDKEVFAEYYDGNFSETHGVTTAELKDVGFLTSKGWEFDG